MSAELAKREEILRYGFDEEQIKVIKATITPGVSDAELALFLTVCQKSGLDPFSRQIYLSERISSDGRGGWITKRAPETTIDGFRVIAERSGKYAGQTAPLWCGPEGTWRDVWLEPHPPAAAKVGILRTDFEEPCYAVALYSEYVQKKKDGTPNSMWQKMAANQLAKCAESLALRKAFPRDLSGFYSREEMGQSEVTATEAREDVKRRKLAAIDQVKQIEAPKEGVGLADLEDRHAAEVAEAQAVIDETEAKHKAKRKRGDVSFRALAAFGEMKKVLREVTGDDRQYYEILSTAGVQHADELAHEPSRAVYKAMASVLATLRANKTTEQELQAEAARIGHKYGEASNDKFFGVLGANGFENVAEILDRASSEQTTTILKELREL